MVVAALRDAVYCDQTAEIFEGYDNLHCELVVASVADGYVGSYEGQ